MKSYLLAIGGTGNKILESIVWAACADALWATDEQGEECPLDEVTMLSVDVDASCGNTTRAMQACARYDRVRAMFADYPYPHQGFHTRLSLKQWDMDLNRRSASVEQMTVNHKRDQLLSRALFDSAESSLAYSEGFRGHPDLGVLFFSDLLNHLDEQGEKGRRDDLLSLLEEIEGQLRAGEKVKLVLCGSVFGGTGASGIPILSRFLRERFASWIDLLEMGAVLMLPYYRVPAAAQEDTLEIVVSSEQFLDKARTALQYYGMEGLIRNGIEDKHGLYDAVYLLGLPESCFVTTKQYATGSKHQLNDAHLLEWLATRCIGTFFRTDYREDKGKNINCYYYQIASNRFGWEGFDTEASRYRRAYGGLLKTSALFLAEFDEVLHDRITDPHRMRDRSVNYYAAYFGKLRRMKNEDRERMAQDLDALTALCRGYAEWMMQVITNLPPQLRNAKALEAAIQEAEENYKQLLELHGQLTLMEREAEQGGMTQEQVVHRTADSKDTLAEQMVRAIRERRDKLAKLNEQQTALNKRIGGQARIDMMARTEVRLNHLADAMARKISELEDDINKENLKPTVLKSDKVISTARSNLRRLEKQQIVLTAEQDKLHEDARLAVLDKARAIPPEIDEEETALPGNDLFDPATLGRLCALLDCPEGEHRERRRLARQVEEHLHELVLCPSPDPVTARRLFAMLGDGAGSGKGSPLACFTAQLLNDVMEEAR